MKHKQSYFLGGSFALVLFMMLGYLVKFYPADLVRIDADIQIALRADLPRHWIAFFKIITNFGHEIYIFIYVFALASLFYVWKKWKMEAFLLVGNLLFMGVLSTGFKYLYNRPRPDIP